MEALGIGQLARRGGVGIDTVRYYERNGLLTPQMRLASGYRRYGAIELARLRFIRRAQGLGFTLKEIKQLLALSAQCPGHGRAADCPILRALTDEEEK
jgi:MerR family transcriptional regulator, copper efflux regulator